MPKLLPIPDEVSKPFWDAANEKRLAVQSCTECSRLQYPPRATCLACGSSSLSWKDTDGRGHILLNMVVHDGRLARMRPEQPFNAAVITLDEDPRLNFLSNLPGLPPHEVPIGAPVEVFFVEPDSPEAVPSEMATRVSSRQLIPEWRLVEG